MMISRATRLFAAPVPCDNGAVYQFTWCPPRRRFQAVNESQFLLTDFVATQGIPRDWQCGRTSGLRLAPNTTTPRVLVSNVTAPLGQGFSFSLWFQPGTSSMANLQTILIFGGWEHDEHANGCLGRLLHIGQYGNHILLRYRDASGICRVLLLRSGVGLLEDSSITKLTVVADRNATLSFLDGRLLQRSTGMDLSSSDNAAGCLRLFGSRDNDVNHFRGALYRLSFRNDTSLLPLGLVFANQTDCDTTGVFPVFNLTGAVAPAALMVPQGSNGSFALSLPIPDSVEAEIRLLSLPNYGVLLSNNLHETSLSLNGSVPLGLEYALKDLQFFNNPHINVHAIDERLDTENFSYQLQSYDDDGYLVGESPVIDASVVVQLVNHRPQIQAPETAMETGNTWTVANVQVLDTADRDMIFLRVDVSSRFGRITVTSEEARSLLRNYDCSGRTASPWQCAGDGYQDRRLIFVAAPSDATRILQKLEYQSLSSSRPEADNVTITVYDGAGGDCLTLEEHWSYQESLGNDYPSLHPLGCVAVKATVSIPGFLVESTGGFTTEGARGANGALPDVLFWLLFLAALFCFCCSRLRTCALRGSAIDADDYGDDFEQGPTNDYGPDVVMDHYPVEDDSSIMSSVYLDEVSLS